MVAVAALDIRNDEVSNGDLDERINAIMEELRDEYLQDHEFPWVIGFPPAKNRLFQALEKAQTSRSSEIRGTTVR